MANLSNETRKRLYLNTLVFCLIGGVVSLGLLAMLMYGGGVAARYTPFIVTVEVGLLFVVISAFVSIVRNEKRDRKLAENARANLVAVKNCPDYWTLSSDPLDSDKSVCVRRYIAPPTTDGATDNTTIIVVQPTPVGVNATRRNRDTVSLSDMDNKSMGEVCEKVRQQTGPWSDLVPLCDAYRI
jgi:hypothetical protein